MDSRHRIDASGRILLIAGALWTVFAFGYSITRGIVHDYPAYLDQWENILAGGDPWDGSMPARNAYGPVHTIMAPLIEIHPLLPKLLMVAAFLAMNLIFIRRLSLQRTATWQVALYALFIPLNGCILIWGIAYGDNDILVAALVGFALLARSDKRLMLAGFLLGLAVMLKFYPLALIPLFALDRRSISLRLMITAGITTFAGLFISFLYWGGNSLSSILFASQREPSMNSIWALLIEHGLLRNSPEIEQLLIDYNIFLVGLVFCAWIAAAWWWKVPWLPSSIVGLLLILLTYKVGHGQFYVSWLVLCAGLTLQRSQRDQNLAIACLPAALGASVVAVGFDLQRELGALPQVGSFLFAWVTLIAGGTSLIWMIGSALRRESDGIDVGARRDEREFV